MKWLANTSLNEHSVKPSEFYNPLTLYRGLKLKTFNNANQLIDNYVSNEKYVSYRISNVIHRYRDPKQGLQFILLFQ